MTSHWHLRDAFTLFSPVDHLAESCDVSVGVWVSAASGLTAHLCQVARPLFACTLRRTMDGHGEVEEEGPRAAARPGPRWVTV